MSALLTISKRFRAAPTTLPLSVSLFLRSLLLFLFSGDRWFVPRSFHRWRGRDSCAVLPIFFVPCHPLSLSFSRRLAGWLAAGWLAASQRTNSTLLPGGEGRRGRKNLLSIPPRHVESPNKNYRSLFFLTVKLFISERGLFPTNFRPFRPLENSNRKQILETFVKERLLTG